MIALSYQEAPIREAVYQRGHHWTVVGQLEGLGSMTLLV